jgi:hypothetical protein
MASYRCVSRRPSLDTTTRYFRAGAAVIERIFEH